MKSGKSVTVSAARARIAGTAAAFLAAGAWLCLAGTPAAAADWDFAGSVESKLSTVIAPRYDGTSGAASGGFEEFANLRLKARAGENGTVYAAVNIVAVSGESASAAAPFVAGQGYAAALELERLYYRVEGKAFDAEAGLMRLAFGYGQAWSPSDFLNPRNPLLADARPRGLLALALSAYPAETVKLKAFAVAGANPLATRGEGTLFGATADSHGGKASLQVLYAYRSPYGSALGAGTGSGAASGTALASTSDGVHYAGASLKIDAGAAFVLDALYAGDMQFFGDPKKALKGLGVSAGLDYSFLGGDLYALCQYLYNGRGALEPGEGIGKLYDPSTAWQDKAPKERIVSGLPRSELNRRNYLYSALSYRLDAQSSATASCVASLDDLSFSPALAFEHEPFQGIGLSLSCRVPLDARTFGASGDFGELGPRNTGEAIRVVAKARLRF